MERLQQIHFPDSFPSKSNSKWKCGPCVDNVTDPVTSEGVEVNQESDWGPKDDTVPIKDKSLRIKKKITVANMVD